MIISCEGKTSQVMFDFLGDIPLSVDWANQWHASTGRPPERSNLELFFKPEWGDNNAALTYNQHSLKRISPEEIHNVLTAMFTAKTTLAQNLART
mgnify:FL=1